MGLRDFNFVTGVETSSIPDVTNATTDDETPSYGQTNSEYTSSKTQGNNVADLTALKALITQGALTPFGRVLGQAIYCRANNLFYVWTPASSLISDGENIVRPDDIATDGTAGRWLSNPALLLRFANDTDFTNFRGAALAGGNIYFNTTTKTARLYDGAIFTGLGGGGGGGASVEPIELKSQWEKQGVVYPLSTPNMLNESFVDSTNVVITPRESYVSGTTFHADINKTDLDLMNATTGWTAGTNTPTVSQDTTQKIEGSGSVMQTKASLNGTIDMYKTFTAFSLYNKQLNFSIYLDTISNLLRAFVKIESSAGNDKTYYFPVANLSAAAWKHLSIDVNKDTADASTGTLDVGNITKIYFGLTTTTGQTISMSVDFLTYQDNYLLNVPYLGYIWDDTNQEEIKISSVLGTGNYQRNTYTLAGALSNGYATGAAYIKQRNVTMLNGQAQFPSGLTGAVAKTVFDITDISFPELVSAKTLVVSQRFWDEEFKVSALPNTTSLKFSCTGDKSAGFKNGDKVVLFNKTWNGVRYESRYNTTMLANFKILTLTADSTYAALETTLTFTGGDNSGADLLNWYIVRMSAEIYYALNAAAANASLTLATPQIFIPKKNILSYIPEIVAHWRFEEASGDAIDSRNQYNLAQQGTVGTYQGKVGKTRGYCSSSNYFRRNMGGLSNTNFDKGLFAVSGWLKNNGMLPAVQMIIGKGNGVSASQGFAAYLDLASGKLTFAKNSNALAGNSSLQDNAWHFFFMGVRAASGTDEIRMYIDNVKQSSTQSGAAHTPSTNDLVIGATATPNLPCDNTLFDELMYWDLSAMPYSWTQLEYLINLLYKNGVGDSMGYDNGYIMRASIDSLTGQQLRTATKLTRQDTTNQNPIIYQRDAIIL